MMKGVADEVHAEVLSTLEEGISAGETFDELSARVKAIFNDMAKHRAETIARTETGAAYETARYFAFKTAGITKKAWLSGGDDGVTRDTHMAADGQKRGIDDFFEVGQARLLHPADHVHGADHPEELINCRCVLIAAE
jgi:SPP1 gp7 family putative phage head morphogenesis protein